MALLKRQVWGQQGLVCELTGLDPLIEKLGQYADRQMKGFREAAKAAGKIIQAGMRAEVEANTGKSKTINVNQMSDYAREQVANGTVSIRRLRTKAEKLGPLTQAELEWANQRQKQGKAISFAKLRRQKTIREDVKVANFVSKRGAMGVYGKTGSLKKSINYKIWSPKAKAVRAGGRKWKRSSSGIVYLIVGPTRIQTAAYNELAGKVQPVNTLKYAHLVEKGHRKVVFGHKYPGRVPAYPFMSKGFQKTRMLASAAAIRILKEHLRNARIDAAGRRVA